MNLWQIIFAIFQFLFEILKGPIKVIQCEHEDTVRPKSKIVETKERLRGNSRNLFQLEQNLTF